jgi:hypothetical protein
VQTSRYSHPRTIAEIGTAELNKLIFVRISAAAARVKPNSAFSIPLEKMKLG